MASDLLAAYRIVNHGAYLFGAVREHVPWLWWDRRVATVTLPEPEVLAARLAAPRRAVWTQPALFEAVR